MQEVDEEESKDLNLPAPKHGFYHSKDLDSSSLSHKVISGFNIE